MILSANCHPFRFASAALVLLFLGAGCFKGEITWTETKDQSLTSADTGLAITSPPQTVQAGVCSQAVTVELQKSATTSTPVSLSSDSLSSFSDPACSVPIQSMLIPAGQSSATFYFKATIAGVWTMKAFLNSSLPATQADTILPASADHLGFAVLPSSATAGAVFNTAPQVNILDAYGNLATSASGTVTVSAFSDPSCNTPGGGSLGGTAAQSASSGTASLPGLSYTLAGDLYLQAFVPGLPAMCSAAIPVSAGTAVQLVFATEPSVNATAGASFATEPVVAIQDAYGNTVTSASDSVTLGTSYDSSCSSSGPTLNADTNPLAAAAGAASFSNVNVTATGVIYLSASSSGLSTACSSAVLVSPASPTRLVLSGPSSTMVGNCIYYTAYSQDGFGNDSDATGAGITVNLSGGSGAFYSDSSCINSTTSRTIPSGQYSVGFYYKDVLAENATLAAIDNAGALSTGSLSVTFNTQLAIAGPTTFAAGACVTWTVTNKDSAGNTVSVGGSPVTINLGNLGSSSFYSDSGCTSLATTASIAGGGSSQVFYVKDNVAESTSAYAYATSGPIYGSPYFDFTVTPGAVARLLLAGPDLLKQGACVGMKVLASDSFGNVENVGTPTTVNLSSTSGANAQFYSNGTCTGGISAVSILSGTNYATFYVKDVSAPVSAATLTVSSSGLSPANMLQDIVADPTVLPLNVATGDIHACAAVLGGVQCWGFNGSGQLGNGTNNSSAVPVIAIPPSSGVTQVAAGGNHTCAVVNGGVLCWGGNYYGQLGDGTTFFRNSPGTAIPPASGVTQVSTGAYHTCAVVSGGVLCWGNNTYGQLGDGTTTERHSPVTAIPSGSGVTAVTVGAYHSCAIMSGGVECWGLNAPYDVNTGGGQLGDGTAVDHRSTPTPVSGISSGATAVAAGGFFTCAVVGGGVQCWGDNSSGQLGLGGGTDYNSHPNPLQVFSLAPGAGATGISGGYMHACVEISGDLKCWGENYEGALGDGTTTPKTAPTQVQGLTSGIASSSGGAVSAFYGDFSCAVSVTSGAAGVLCWGQDSYGQTGPWPNTKLAPVWIQLLN